MGGRAQAGVSSVSLIASSSEAPATRQRRVSTAAVSVLVLNRARHAGGSRAGSTKSVASAAALKNSATASVTGLAFFCPACVD